MLGPYKLLTPLGRGGMGEVYRGRDTRLDRDVAIKVLPERFARDPDALSRFRREAKAVASLSHPNIRGIFDIGEEGDIRFAAMELLEGQSLGVRLGEGPLTPQESIDIGYQVAQGLSAAHQKGIVHRDLKPENVFLTKGGLVKILDFGLARQAQSDSGLPGSPTLGGPLTVPGFVVGTPGYMSPEQVRGQDVDARTDIFALGCVLWEGLAGRPAFRAGSAVETMNAILTQEPPVFAEAGVSVPPAVEKVVRRCLEKDPALRFPSALDVAFALQTASMAALPQPAAVDVPRRDSVRDSRPRWPRALGVLAAVVLVLAAFVAGWAAKPGPASVEPTFRRLTFRRGNVLAGRFGPDSQTVVYSAAWDDRPAEVFVSRVGRPEARALGLVNGSIRSVAPDGELTVLLTRKDVFAPAQLGDVIRVPFEGGAPRLVANAVTDAHSGPDGASLASVRADREEFVLEFPAGKILRRSPRRLSQLKISPSGEFVALSERFETGPTLVVLDRTGRVVVSRPVAADGIRIAWSPSGKEVWYSLRRGNEPLGIHAIDLKGNRRLVLAGAGIVLHDIALDGRVLLETFFLRDGFLFERQGQPARDLSWLEDSGAVDLSPDGTMVLIAESGEGGGEKGSAYLRETSGALPVRLGEGEPCALSPDGKWALVRVSGKNGYRFDLLPTGAGAARSLDTSRLELFDCGKFLPPDGLSILVTGRPAGGRRRPYRIDLTSGLATPAGPEGHATTRVFSADGSRWVLSDEKGRWVLFDPASGLSEPVAGLGPEEQPLLWSLDGRSLLVRRVGEVPAIVDWLELGTGARREWKSLVASDRAGIIHVEGIVVAPDASSWAFDVSRVQSSDLWLVEGLR